MTLPAIEGISSLLRDAANAAKKEGVLGSIWGKERIDDETAAWI